MTDERGRWQKAGSVTDDVDDDDDDDDVVVAMMMMIHTFSIALFPSE